MGIVLLAVQPLAAGVPEPLVVLHDERAAEGLRIQRTARLRLARGFARRGTAALVHR